MEEVVSPVEEVVTDVAGPLILDALLNLYWFEGYGASRIRFKDYSTTVLHEIAYIARAHMAYPKKTVFYLLRDDQQEYAQAEPVACPTLILRMVRYVLSERGEDISDIPEVDSF